jgi:hypothetical protein
MSLVVMAKTIKAMLEDANQMTLISQGERRQAALAGWVQQ